MTFDIDVLIVFAEKDNEAANKTELGWVSQFKKFLELMLNQVLGEKSNIMLKAEYDSITSPKLDNVGVLVSILSKDFIQSGQCLDHIEVFHKTIDSSSKGRNRVFKVFKT
ncbi:MAG: hypothetical protein ACOYXT_20490, partial [Bacteroidota bacterium]